MFWVFLTPAACRVLETRPRCPIGWRAGALLITKLEEPLLALDELYISNVIVGFGAEAIKFSCHSTVNSAQVRWAVPNSPATIRMV